MIKNKTGWLTKKLDKLDYSRGEIPRDYIGASSIGADCMRQIWYEFKGKKSNPKDIAPKLHRTWNIGRNLESLIVEWLTKAGVKLIVPHETNHYLEFFDAEYPYLRGHCDAILIKPKAILEIKTAKDSSFKVLVKRGVYDWDQKYYSQIQSYMGMSGIKKTYVLALNKDTSDFYDEQISFDEHYYKSLQQKAFMIHEASEPPPKVNDSPLWFQCRMCKFSGSCHS